MSLLHLKSIFGPNTDITPWQADVHLNEKITNHVHHKGGGGEVFHPEGHTLLDDDVRPFIEIYNTNKPIDKFDTKFNYNETSLINQTYGFGVKINSPILDSVLRGRVYEQKRFSQNFDTNTAFVIQPQDGLPAYRTDLFDTRSTTPKEGTLYFNTNNTLGTLQYGQGGFFTQVSTLNNDFNNNSITDFSTSGFKGAPYTRLNDLGKSPLDDLSWEKLYNKNHTPKNNSTHQGIIPINYGGIVNRDKLNIRDSSTKSSLYNFSRTSLLFPNQGEPYIISDIALAEGVHSGGRLINQGPLLGVPINRMVADTARITKFLSSPKGISFIAAQNFLGANSKSVFISKDGKLQSSAQRFKKLYNPTSTLLQTLGRSGFSPIGLVDKTELNLGLDIFKSDEYGKEGTVNHKIDDTFTKGSVQGTTISGFGQFASALGSNLLGTAKTIKPKSGGGDKMTLAKIIEGNNLTVTGQGTKGLNNGQNTLEIDVEETKEGMPFYFKDLRDSKYIFFRAYIEGLTENIAPSWAETNYIGRSEPVYVYERATREISMTLKLAAQTRDELDKIYEKMEKLTSLCYPEYRADDDYGNRMKPPLTKLRMGELFGSENKELLGFIKSISYSVEQSTTYETEKEYRVPKHVTATLSYQVIHNDAPSLNMKQKFYGINK
tara:strand:- start:3807 stop:5786 length:1980 start_codon:yes stop_codon:yes gene_type:complete